MTDISILSHHTRYIMVFFVLTAALSGTFSNLLIPLKHVIWLPVL
jgi:hypothetical protein